MPHDDEQDDELIFCDGPFSTIETASQGVEGLGKVIAVEPTWSVPIQAWRGPQPRNGHFSTAVLPAHVRSSPSQRGKRRKTSRYARTMCPWGDHGNATHSAWYNQATRRPGCPGFDTDSHHYFQRHGAASPYGTRQSHQCAADPQLGILPHIPWCRPRVEPSRIFVSRITTMNNGGGFVSSTLTQAASNQLRQSHDISSTLQGGLQPTHTTLSSLLAGDHLNAHGTPPPTSCRIGV